MKIIVMKQSNYPTIFSVELISNIKQKKQIIDKCYLPKVMLPTL